MLQNGRRFFDLAFRMLITAFSLSDLIHEAPAPIA